MTQTLQLEEAVERTDSPQLLVEWSPRWRDFVDSIGPALGRSEARLAGEAPFGLIPLRIMIPSYLLEAFVVFAVIAIQVKIQELRPYVVPRLSSHDVIYYSGDELPRTEDLGGAQTGTTGEAGGDEAHHRTQTIKIARGGSLVQKIVDAPNLKLPNSAEAVANLLAIRPNAGPPPSEGFRSNRLAPRLPTTLVAPAPNAIRDYTRNGVQLDTVIAPAPNVTRDRITAPTFNATLIPPAPSVTSDHTLVAPALAPIVIPPAPNASHDRRMNAPTLGASVVAPAPTADRDRTRSAPVLAGNVIPPAPGAVTHQLTSAPIQMTNPSVIPPPVSAPESASSRNSKVMLPAPSIVAPPPSADISQDMRRLIGGSVPDPSKSVVPPPPTQAGSGSFMSSLMGKIFGSSEVVPPPPSVHTDGVSGGTGTTLNAKVVPPPPTVGENAPSGSPRGSRNGLGSSPESNVVAPPPSVGTTNGTGRRSGAALSGPTLGQGTVVPPPPSLSGAGGGTGTTGGGAGAPGGTLLANNVVPPPPSVGGGSSASGSGLGHRGTGFGAPLDPGTGVAPPTSGGSGSNSGGVISTNPGTKIGLPTSGGPGSLAMSPSGGDKPGLGGAGGGNGLTRGNGPGSGMTGNGNGAGKTGNEHGAETTAKGGISTTAGPGGAGNLTSGNPPIRGYDIKGGNSEVNLPSFGSDSPASDPATANHATPKHSARLEVDVVASANSGGAFEPYKNLLRGEKHTIYPVASDSTIVMEYADESATRNSVSLTRPEAIRTDLPAGLPHARMVLACTLDAAGNLRNVRILEPGPEGMAPKVVAALHAWKFQPAMRGDQPVAVTAILGFGIDTNDRF